MFRLRLRQRPLLVPPAHPSPAAAGAASVCSSCRLQFTTISRRNAQKITWHEQHFSFAWRLRHEILVMIRSSRGHKHDATNNRNNSNGNSNYNIATATATTARRCRRRSRRRKKEEGEKSWQRSHVALRGSTKFRFSCWVPIVVQINEQKANLQLGRIVNVATTMAATKLSAAKCSSIKFELRKRQAQK